MPRTQFQLQPGSGKYFIDSEDNPNQPYGLSGNVFHHVQSGEVPYFVLNDGSVNDTQELLDRLAEAADGNTQPGVKSANVLGLTIPRGMTKLNNLLDYSDPGAGVAMANIGNKYEAFQIKLLQELRQDSEAERQEHESLGVNHFCTDFEIGDARSCSATQGNCPKMICQSSARIGLSDASPKIDPLVARFDLFSHFQSEYQSEALKKSEIYKLFDGYIGETEGEFTTIFQNGVTLLGSYLPDHTVMWIPIPDDSAQATHEKLKDLPSDTVFYSEKAVYCDTLDIWFGYPFEALTCQEARERGL
ncbi:hypothetical protein CLV84_1119 [Neolewinella xylanilytica]|uniref:Uncharacterized protein n=1 Tax=Neolewinella xylanilytica TaxID=1514080 RepID=A0A2S6I9H8_9BACT|nr:hypothetical protein [Neolewinella xylanilytica]PPK88154.1 hypothetical protein CLV84_1119 [Neolewinella xylanilytica]